ncbi:hypothetical protein IE53DRAFT_147184, partial [Violaceomyces palustris]
MIKTKEESAIDDAFDDAYRSYMILKGQDPSTLPDPYSKHSSSRKGKTKRISGGSTRNPSSEPGGGGGGFLREGSEEEGGGFLPSEAGGGFVLDDEEEGEDRDLESDFEPRRRVPSIPLPSHLPLSAIPDALSNLGLESQDATVLELFRDASYLPPGSKRGGFESSSSKGVKVERVVGRDEFRQFAQILIGEVGGGGREDEGRAGEGGNPGGKRRRVEVSKDEEERDSILEAGRGEWEDGERKSRSSRPSRSAAVRGRKSLRLSLEEEEEEEEEDDSMDEFGGGGKNDDQESDLSSISDSDLGERRKGGKVTTPVRKKGKGRRHEEEEEDDDDGEEPSGRRKGAAGGLRRKRRSKGRKGTDEEDDHLDSEEEEEEEEGYPRLNPNQREQVLAAFQLFTERLDDGGGPTFNSDQKKRSISIPTRMRRLTFEDVKTISKSLGEKLTDRDVSFHRRADVG